MPITVTVLVGGILRLLSRSVKRCAPDAEAARTSSTKADSGSLHQEPTAPSGRG